MPLLLLKMGCQEALRAMPPEQAENKSYAESMQNPKAALNAGKIDLQEYNAATEQMEQQHQANLPKYARSRWLTPPSRHLQAVDPRSNWPTSTRAGAGADSAVLAGAFWPSERAGPSKTQPTRSTGSRGPQLNGKSSIPAKPRL